MPTQTAQLDWVRKRDVYYIANTIQGVYVILKEGRTWRAVMFSGETICFCGSLERAKIEAENHHRRAQPLIPAAMRHSTGE